MNESLNTKFFDQKMRFKLNLQKYVLKKKDLCIRFF